MVTVVYIGIVDYHGRCRKTAPFAALAELVFTNTSELFERLRRATSSFPDQCRVLLRWLESVIEPSARLTQVHNMKLFMNPSADLAPDQATAMVERWIALNRVRVAFAFAAVVCATIAMRR